jgi:hypothetical protein
MATARWLPRRVCRTSIGFPRPRASSTTRQSRGVTARSPHLPRRRPGDHHVPASRVGDGPFAHGRRRERDAAASRPALWRRAWSPGRHGGARDRAGVRWVRPMDDRRGTWCSWSGPRERANYALAGAAAVDITTASMAYPIYDFSDWDAVRGRAARAWSSSCVLPIGAEAGRLLRAARARVGLHRRALKSLSRRRSARRRSRVARYDPHRVGGRSRDR